MHLTDEEVLKKLFPLKVLNEAAEVAKAAQKNPPSPEMKGEKGR